MSGAIYEVGAMVWQCPDCLSNVKRGKAELCPRCEAFAAQDHVALRETPYSQPYLQGLQFGDVFKTTRSPSIEDSERFHALLNEAELSPVERDVLSMRFLDDLSLSEIAQRLGCSKTWAFKQLGKGIKKMKQGLTNLRLMRGTSFSTPHSGTAPLSLSYEQDSFDELASSGLVDSVVASTNFKKSNSGDKVMNLLRCPRCGTRGFERFPIYGICHDCNYFEVKSSRTVVQQKSTKQLPTTPDPHPFQSEAQGVANQFTDGDHRIVRRAMLSIPEREQKVVFLYFWKDQKKQEIAERLGFGVEQVEKILTSAYERLRALCEKNPKFSRALRRSELAA